MRTFGPGNEDGYNNWDDTPGHEQGNLPGDDE
jgi:hypothetical protein